MHGQKNINLICCIMSFRFSYLDYPVFTVLISSDATHKVQMLIRKFPDNILCQP